MSSEVLSAKISEIISCRDNTNSMQELCMEFGRLLGLNKPVPEEVLNLAVEDPSYAHHLLVCKSTPEFLTILFEVACRSEMKNRTMCPSAKSSKDIVVRAAAALWSWTKTGFALLDNDIYNHRLGICSACPHLGDPPDSLLYNISSLAAGTDKICTLCGCFLKNKAKLPSERCPDRHPTKQDLSRWEELYH